MTSRVSQGGHFNFGRKIASHGVSIIGNHLVNLLTRKTAGEGRKRKRTTTVRHHTDKRTHKVTHAGAWQLPHSRHGRGKKELENALVFYLFKIDFKIIVFNLSNVLSDT